uniref:Uncharacterized protein n=2 Tax=Oryza sativa subsp. japonica TaxID=39947 RepID=Q69RW8_ORYSJ|nr:hypothetical protein [Oryza sativa Japonica Group]BAD31652.1 hypothetical protein [Oryza sativa Japonica Group]
MDMDAHATELQLIGHGLTATTSSSSCFSSGGSGDNGMVIVTTTPKSAAASGSQKRARTPSSPSQGAELLEYSKKQRANNMETQSSTAKLCAATAADRADSDEAYVFEAKTVRHMELLVWCGGGDDDHELLALIDASKQGVVVVQATAMYGRTLVVVEHCIAARDTIEVEGTVVQDKMSGEGCRACGTDKCHERRYSHDFYYDMAFGRVLIVAGFTLCGMLSVVGFSSVLGPTVVGSVGVDMAGLKNGMVDRSSMVVSFQGVDGGMAGKEALGNVHKISGSIARKCCVPRWWSDGSRTNGRYGSRDWHW